MKALEKYSLEIEAIQAEIDKLKNNQIYEIDSVPGAARASTIGLKSENQFRALIAKIDEKRKSDLTPEKRIKNLKKE